MTKFIRNTLLLVLCLAITISAFAACSTKKVEENPSSSPDSSTSSEITSSEENPSSEEEVSSEETIEDDNWGEDVSDDIFDEDEVTEDVYIDNATVKNGSAPIMTTYRGFGSIVHQMYEYMPYKNKQNEYTEEQAQEQFNRMQTIGIDLIRSDWNTYMTYDAEKKDFDFENTEYIKAFYKAGLELKKRNIDISVTTGWSHHALVDDSSSIPSKELYVHGNWNATLNNWKVWMEKSILNFRSHGLTNINTLILFTEPGKIDWNDTNAKNRGDGKDDAYRIDMWNKWIETAKTLDKSLKEMGLRDEYILVGPNQATAYEYRGGAGDFMKYVAERGGDEYLDVYSSHNYVKPNDATQDTCYDFMDATYRGYLLDQLRNECGSTKPFWIDEWNVGEAGYSQLHRESPWRGTQLGVCATAIMEFGIENSMMWTLYSQQWPNNTSSGGEFTDGIQMCGLALGLNFTTVPTTQYYAFALLSKFLSTTDTVYTVEYDKLFGLYYAYATNDEGDVTIIVVNAYSGGPQGFELNFEKSLGGKNLYRHLYDPTTCKANGTMQIIPADRAYKSVEDKLVDLLPAGALAVYTTVKA